jgi:hypothetical protein
VQHRIGARHARSVEQRMSIALSDAEMRILHQLCERLSAAQSELRPSRDTAVPIPSGTAADQEIAP